nr:MAG TPA: hypothetical protein [Caudoviricetes sp.]
MTVLEFRGIGSHQPRRGARFFPSVYAHKNQSGTTP